MQLALAKQTDDLEDVPFADKPPKERLRILKAALAAGIFFLWDKKRGKFVSTKTGNVIRAATLRRWVIAATGNLEQLLEKSAGNLAQQKITQGQFQVTMQKEIVKAEGAMSASAMGGLKQMMPAQWNKVAVQISKQRGALVGFGADIVRSQLSPAEIIARAQLYARSIYATHINTMTDLKTSMGARFAKRILHQGSIHCEDCPDLADLGWVPIDELVPIGDTACIVNCRCAVQYSDAATVQEAGAGYVGAIGMPD